jgi:hygromycin-B 7''-O-kinase
MTSLLPSVSTIDDYRRIRRDEAIWLPAMRELCRRQRLDPETLARQGFGTHVVYRAGDRIVKLYVPLWLEDFRAERAALKPLRGLPVPELLAEDELEGWPCLVLSVVPGVAAGEVWPTLDGDARRGLAREIGSLMRRLHEQAPVPELAIDWNAFVEERIAVAEEFHAVEEPWRSWIRSRLAVFREQPSTPVLVHADITEEQVLVREGPGGWTVSGLIDFGDAMMGHPHYEFIAPLAFFCFGDPGVSRALLEGYGLRPTRDLEESLTTWCLLHRFGNLSVFLAKHPAASGEEFHRALWG